MQDTRISTDEAAVLKGMILEAAALEEQTRIDLIASPVADVVNCRVEVQSSFARKALVDRYHGVAIGGSVYFILPWHEAND